MGVTELSRTLGTNPNLALSVLEGLGRWEAGMGRVAMPCTTPAYTPRFAASGLKPPKSSSADQVGVHT